MRTLHRSQAGFSPIEVILVLVIIVAIGGVGGYVYHAQKNADKSLAPVSSGNPTFKKQLKTVTSTTATDPYAGWKTATLAYEKLTYKYPSNWTITDKSEAQPRGQGCVYPGFDQVSLVSPSNETVLLHTGIDCIGDGGVVTFGSVPVQSLGQSLYLAFENNSGAEAPGPSSPLFACLGQTNNPSTPFDFKSKNINFSSTSGDNSSPPANSFCYYPYSFDSASSLPTESVASIESSPDYATAKLILESLEY